MIPKAGDDVEDVFTVCVLFAYAVEGEADARMLFETDEVLTVLAFEGVDAQLVGLLRGVVENGDDIRVLCGAAAWSQKVDWIHSSLKTLKTT
ncbi:hypothetical protein ACOZ4B_02105 [Haloferax prahovense]|uniref:hypothetical protein n=1 Tax=Haloferax prahovense TaxID=381852 RepID=UPI003C75BFF8